MHLSLSSRDSFSCVTVSTCFLRAAFSSFNSLHVHTICNSATILQNHLSILHYFILFVLTKNDLNEMKNFN